MAAKFTRKDFLEALFDDYCHEIGGFIMVRSSSRPYVKISTRYFPNIDALTREQYAEEQHVYFGTCPHERMKADKEHIRYATAVWTALDIGPDGYSGKDKHFFNDRQAIAAVKSFPRAPSIIVRSGRGIHLYWLLKRVRELHDVEGFESMLRRISDYFQCPGEVGIDAALRLPETHNPKNPAHAIPCKIEHLDPGCRYSLEDFEGLDLRIIIPSKKAPKPPPMPTVQPVRVAVISEPGGAPQPLRDVLHGSVGPSHGPGVPFTPVYIEPPPATANQPIISSPETPRSNDAAVTLDEESIEKLALRLSEVFAEKMLDKIVDGVVDRLWARLGNARKNE